MDGGWMDGFMIWWIADLTKFYKHECRKFSGSMRPLNGLVSNMYFGFIMSQEAKF